MTKIEAGFPEEFNHISKSMNRLYPLGFLDSIPIGLYSGRYSVLSASLQGKHQLLIVIDRGTDSKLLKRIVGHPVLKKAHGSALFKKKGLRYSDKFLCEYYRKDDTFSVTQRYSDAIRLLTLSLKGANALRLENLIKPRKEVFPKGLEVDDIPYLYVYEDKAKFDGEAIKISSNGKRKGKIKYRMDVLQFLLGADFERIYRTKLPYKDAGTIFMTHNKFDGVYAILSGKHIPKKK